MRYTLEWPDVRDSARAGRGEPCHGCYFSCSDHMSGMEDACPRLWGRHEAAGRTAAMAMKKRTDKGGWTGTPQGLPLVTHVLQRDSTTVAQLNSLLKPTFG